MAVATTTAQRRPRFNLGKVERRNLRWGLIFISPWLIGFLVFGVLPIVYTFYLSLTRYSGLRDAVFIGISNYTRLAADPLFWKASTVTLNYTLLAVPIGVVVAMLLAMAMNQKAASSTEWPTVSRPWLRRMIALQSPKAWARRLPSSRSSTTPV